MRAPGLIPDRPLPNKGTEFVDVFWTVAVAVGAMAAMAARAETLRHQVTLRISPT